MLNTIAVIMLDYHLPKILLFGDSITHIWHAPKGNFFSAQTGLTMDYQRKFDVVGRGFIGYNSDEANVIFDPILEDANSGVCKVKLMILFFGTNDSNTWQVQHVPVERYKENLRDITKRAQKAGIKVIIVGPGLFDEYNPNEKGRTTANQRLYCDAAAEVAKELDTGFIGLWYLFAKSVGWQEGKPIPGQLGVNGEDKIRHLLYDGLHFSGDAHLIYYAEIKKVIKEKYPELHSDNLKEKWPWFEKIDRSNITKSLEDSC